MRNSELSKRDLNLIWHPCTQMKDHEFLPMIPIESGKGVYLYDFEGNGYIDAVSSWWVNLFGHSNRQINEALSAQSQQLEHVILAGFTHKPAIDLAEAIDEITPSKLTKIFFADNGSSAVEVALKMSYHYHRNLGKTKEWFLSLTNSYHGETLGALSVGDVALYKETYAPLLIKNLQTPVPIDQTIEAAQEAAEALEQILKTKGEQISAFIVEPLIQGAGNMHMYHPFYLQEAQRLCRAYGVHLIADEIMTGFGRTGEMFGCSHANIEPDFMLLSKGLTGGYLPLALVVTTQQVYDAFYCEYESYRAFLHSHSYTGNPLACSVALASLEIFKHQNIIENNRVKSAKIFEAMKGALEGLRVKNLRRCGMVFAFEIEEIEGLSRAGVAFYQYALSQGVLLRPLGNTIYFMPPYIIEDDEIKKVIDVMAKGVEYLNAKKS